MTENHETPHITGFSRLFYAAACLLTLSFPLFLSSSASPSLIERIIKQGFLPVLSSNGPITYYEGPFGYTGFEYELAEAFADSLGVELAITDEPNRGTLLDNIGKENGLFGASNISITSHREKKIRFTEPYMTVEQHIIYQRGSNEPVSYEDLIDLDVVVAKHGSYIEILEDLKLTYPELKWRALENVDQLDLLELVHSGKADITIMDSTAYTVNRNIYPRARKAFNLPSSKEIAWAFPKKGDSTLFNAANLFLKDHKNKGKLDQLITKYFESDYLDVGGALTLSSHIDNRLPLWESYFKKTADDFNLDWLFLAAMSYQESHWNKNAKSFTGVRGLMMLTRNTAKSLGVKDRNDPQESIHGGAKYLVQRLESLPDRIVYPDKLWMALAAYNVGLGHLEDARVLTEKFGGDPDKWEEVKQNLPLLSKKKYYKETKHGYARGYEPVRYVENIRNYYRILVWHHEAKQRRLANELEREIDPIDVSLLEPQQTTEL